VKDAVLGGLQRAVVAEGVSSARWFSSIVAGYRRRMSQGDGGRLVAVSVELTPDQERWLRTTAERVGESPDALVRQAIQLLRRLSTFRRLA
jgi:hypothetical protein